MAQPNQGMRPVQRSGDEWRRGHLPPYPINQQAGGVPWGLVITGAVVLGLGYMAWTHLGPDLKRYIKISNM